TGETWYAANDVSAMLERFAIDLDTPSRRLNQWLTALFQLFRPHMGALLAARDASVMSWRRRRRGKMHVLEDRRLEVTAALEIDVEAEIAAIEAALKSPG
ncbi:MAG TPA: hypothetical protein VKT70_09570, partial [Stellaceae bacterium]|nr:hypothetical protein [Stellaceae bacterium]